MNGETDWRVRHGNAALQAKELARRAARVGDQLVLLAHCESDHSTLHGAIAALRAQLASVERLSAEFECVDHYRRAHG